MTKEQVDAVLALGPLIIAAGTSCVPITFAVIKFFDLQKTKAVESSVGATKVAELQKAIENIGSQVQILKENDIRKEKKLDELHDDNKDMIRRIIDWMQK